MHLSKYQLFRTFYDTLLMIDGSNLYANKDHEKASDAIIQGQRNNYYAFTQPLRWD